MKKETYTEVSTKDLRDRLAEMKKDYAQLQINHAISPLDSPAKITHARKATEGYRPRNDRTAHARTQ